MMTESERITAAETKIESLEKRMAKLESSDENRSLSYSSIDTKLQLLGQKFDSFVETLEEKSNNKKFNWKQIIAVIAIIAGLGGSIWSNYSTKQAVENKAPTVVHFSQKDLDEIKESVLSEIGR